MTVLEQKGSLIITALPLEDMALLALGIPLDESLKRVLTALLEGRRVAVTSQAFEYKRYRQSAPLGIYQKFVAMERQLHEMGLAKARTGEG